jgi:hypothetical protein
LKQCKPRAAITACASASDRWKGEVDDHLRE